MKTCLHLFMIFLTLTSGLAEAAPAPWFTYQSLATGQFVCLQHDPGEAFQRFAGPFHNAGCRP
ncbi:MULTISPECIES: hypothetical protein [Pseudomonas]|uniref:Secreted protein n=1 Tax=Pseudomonas quercus TaxID=2722792 RepID=A0ABX0YI61_9PSED|nr:MULTISPECIES: hypothetical protein [Pseudomonas]MBF7144595.1 hypothetical protein [Pseudomonas sp. LY10J]NJP03134.1 hypothetical protein [Pseudomonas quercus]